MNFERSLMITRETTIPELSTEPTGLCFTNCHLFTENIEQKWLNTRGFSLNFNVLKTYTVLFKAVILHSKIILHLDSRTMSLMVRYCIVIYQMVSGIQDRDFRWVKMDKLLRYTNNKCCVNIKLYFYCCFFTIQQYF